MIVDSIDIGARRIHADRADLYAKGLAPRGYSYELRAGGLRDLPALPHAWPAVTVRVNGDAFEGRVFVDDRGFGRLFGFLVRV